MPTGESVAALTQRITADKMNKKLETVDLGDAEASEAEATTPSILGCHQVVVPDTADDIDIILDENEMVIDAWAVKTTGAGGGGDALTIKDGSGNTIATMSLNVADKAITRATDIDDDFATIASGGTLRVTPTIGGGVANCLLFIMVLKVPAP